MIPFAGDDIIMTSDDHWPPTHLRGGQFFDLVILDNLFLRRSLYLLKQQDGNLAWALPMWIMFRP